jgi:hypothetical protein
LDLRDGVCVGAWQEVSSAGRANARRTHP